MPITAKDIVTEQILITVNPSQLIGHAQRIMFDHGYKQLPVVDGDGILVGLLTSSKLVQQIRELGNDFESRPISDAHLEDAITTPHTKDIFYLLDILKNPSTILLADESNKLVKIITSRDIAVFFRNSAEDLLLLGLIRDNIKSRIINAFGKKTPALQAVISQLSGSREAQKAVVVDVIKRIAAKSNRDYFELEEEINLLALLEEAIPYSIPKTIDDLTFDELVEIVELNWGTFEADFQKLPMQMWSIMIKDAKVAHEKVFNFKGKVSKSEREKLHHCVIWHEKAPMTVVIPNIYEPW